MTILYGQLEDYHGTHDDTCAFCSEIEPLNYKALRIGERQIGVVCLCERHRNALDGHHQWEISPAKEMAISAR